MGSLSAAVGMSSEHKMPHTNPKELLRRAAGLLASLPFPDPHPETTVLSVKWLLSGEWLWEHWQRMVAAEDEGTDAFYFLIHYFRKRKETNQYSILQ